MRLAAVLPGVAFELATAGEREETVGDDGRAYGLAAVNPLDVLGRVVDRRDGDGPAGVCASRRRSSGRCSRRPTETPSPWRRRQRRSLTDRVDKAPVVGKTEPDASFSGMGKKGLTSAFF